MSKEDKIQLFQKQAVRTHWDEEKELWYFSIIDVIAILTEQKDFQGARNYWKVLKHRLLKEGSETVTNCNRLKMLTKDGKMRMTDIADTEQLLRLIQSVPSPKAEPFKLWLAEASTTEISKEKQPKGLEENKDIARKGGNAAKKARLEIEKQTGKPIVTAKNAKKLLDKPNIKNIENE